MHRFSAIVLLGVVGALATTWAQEKDAEVTATSPDQKLVARAEGRTIRVADAQTQKELLAMQGHADRVTALTFSPDGRFIASGSADRTVCLWDLPTGRQVRRLNLNAGVVTLTLSPDGRTLVAVDANQRTRTFEVATGREIERKK